MLNECGVVLEGCSPAPVGIRIPDGRQATAAVHNSPFHQSENVLYHSCDGMFVYISKEK